MKSFVALNGPNNSFIFVSHRYDKEGHALEGQSLTEMKSGGGGGNTNWKTLWDVKTEHLGHGEKVRTCSPWL